MNIASRELTYIAPPRALEFARCELEPPCHELKLSSSELDLPSRELRTARVVN